MTHSAGEDGRVACNFIAGNAIDLKIKQFNNETK